MARHQAEGRGRAWRDRLPHLLRSARRRLLPGRRLSEGRLPQREGRAARLGGGHAGLSRRSADARRRRDARTRSGCALKDAPTLTKIPVLPISYGDAQPLLAALGGPVAPERVARRAAAHLSPRPRARDGAPEARVRLGHEAVYDVIARLTGSERPDEWVIRGNHHDAWVNGADDPISGMVALLEEARAVGVLREAGLAAAAHDRLRRVGRRGAGPARLDRVGRDACRRAAAESRRLHQHRQQRPRLPRRRRLALARDASSTRSRATSIDPQTQGERVAKRARALADRASAGRRARRRCATGATCASTPLARAPTTRRSSSTSASRR